MLSKEQELAPGQETAGCDNGCSVANNYALGLITNFMPDKMEAEDWGSDEAIGI